MLFQVEALLVYTSPSFHGYESLRRDTEKLPWSSLSLVFRVDHPEVGYHQILMTQRQVRQTGLIWSTLGT